MHYETTCMVHRVHGPAADGCACRRRSCGMTVQVPPGAPWGQPYAKLGLTNSDIDDDGRIMLGAAPVQLYDLKSDLGQHTNVARQESQRAESLRQRMEELIVKPKPKARPQPAPTGPRATLPHSTD
jgi:hypothetical protein